MDFFLAHTLAAETEKETLLNELYAAYKRYSLERRYPTVDAELQTLRKHAPTYEALVSPQSGSLGRLAYALDRFDTRTAYPLVMAMNAVTTDENARSALYSLVEAYVVRRAICRLTPKNYNMIFLRLATVVRESGGSVPALRLAFGEFDGPSRKFPTDADIRSAFAERPLYEEIPQGRLWYILRELEFASRDEFSETVGLKPDLEIEHILPRSWFQHWPLPDGSNASATPDHAASPEQRSLFDRRQSLVHTIGNLTLLTRPANVEVLNYAFDPDKKTRLRSSLLQMNQHVAAKGHWDENAILERADYLADIAIRIWPGPAA